MDRCKCYLCERLCYCDSSSYDKCSYRRQRSFSVPENRAYEEACVRLVVKFAKKHNWRFYGWVGHFDPSKNEWYEGAGGHALVSDEVFSFEDIRADLMMDAHPDAIMEYYEQCVQEQMYASREKREPRFINYRNWLLGARHDTHKCSIEYLKTKEDEIKKLHEQILEDEKQLKEKMLEEFQRCADDLMDGSEGLF